MKVSKKNIIIISIFSILILILIISLNKEKINSSITENLGLKAEDIATKAEYEIIEEANDQFNIVVTMENQNGIEEIKMGDSTIKCNGRTKIAFDKIMYNGEEKDVQIKLVTGEIDEYKLVPTNPKFNILDWDKDNQGTTQVMEINYSNNNTLIKYYSKDNGETWEVYNEPIDVMPDETEFIIAKVGYPDKNIIPRNENSYTKLMPLRRRCNNTSSKETC